MNHGSSNQIETFYMYEKYFEPHEMTSHTDYAIAYHVTGSLKLDHGQILEAEPGMFTIIPAGVPHRSMEGHDIGLWLVSFCAVCHDLDENDPIMNAFQRVRMGALPVAAIPEERHSYLITLLEALRDEGAKITPETAVTSKSLLLLILAEVNRAMRGNNEGTVQKKDELVSKALTFIQTHCLEPISPKDVARAINRTPAHVTAMLKKNTGFSTGQWITAGRLGEATMRLAHTDDSIEIIAEKVGWQDVTHFIRQFKKAYGKTPAAWRSGVLQQKKNDPLVK